MRRIVTIIVVGLILLSFMVGRLIVVSPSIEIAGNNTISISIPDNYEKIYTRTLWEPPNVEERIFVPFEITLPLEDDIPKTLRIISLTSTEKVFKGLEGSLYSQSLDRFYFDAYETFEPNSSHELSFTFEICGKECELKKLFGTLLITRKSKFGFLLWWGARSV